MLRVVLTTTSVARFLSLAMAAAVSLVSPPKAGTTIARGCAVPLDARARVRLQAAEEAKRLDALSKARMRDYERAKRTKVEAERRLELGRRTLDDRRRHAARQAREVERENERLHRAVARSKAIFATREEIDALQGRL